VLTWPAKDPNEVLDYDIDWSERLETGETISTSTWTVVDGTVTISAGPTPPAPSISAGVTTCWISAGTAGEACVVLNRITTSAGRTYDQSVKLRIRSK
jgi:hypothetical protein